MSAPDLTQEEVQQVLDGLRDAVVRTTQERAAWEWAADVALWFMLDEAQDEWREGTQTLRGFVAQDLAYRLGQQLPDLAKDAEPGEAGASTRAEAKAGAVLAERLTAIADAEPLRAD